MPATLQRCSFRFDAAVNWRLPLLRTPSAGTPESPTDHGSAVPARKHAMNDQEHDGQDQRDDCQVEHLVSPSLMGPSVVHVRDTHAWRGFTDAARSAGGWVSRVWTGKPSTRATFQRVKTLSSSAVGSRPVKVLNRSSRSTIVESTTERCEGRSITCGSAGWRMWRRRF
jgi:hypothetical protein